MVSVHLILMILAVICFLIGALDIPWRRGNMIAAGLFFWSLSVLIA